MAQPGELYRTPASRLDAFVTQWLQPKRRQKEEVLDTLWAVEQFLKNERFLGEQGPHRSARVLKVVMVGCYGNGTALRNNLDVELVVFLSCFHSFQDEANSRQTILHMIQRKAWSCQDLLELGLWDVQVTQGPPSGVILSIKTWDSTTPTTVTIVPAYRALGPSAPGGQAPPFPNAACYQDLIAACDYPGQFSPSFSELQRNFVKHQPTKLKSLLRLVKHWYLQYVKARCPKAHLPPLYALELLTIYAWEVGTHMETAFQLDKGFTTVMELLQDSESLCIYWNHFYSLQDPVIGDLVRKQLQRERPIILDPADPTHNVAEGYRWDIMAQRASQCLKQDCCYDSEDNPVPGWDVQSTRVIQVTVELWNSWKLSFRVNPYDPVKKLMKKIQRSKGFSGQLHLSFQEPGGERQPLNPTCTLASHGIFSDTLFSVVETVFPEIQVFVKGPDGESQAYVTHPNSFVSSLKQQIEFQCGLPKKQQQLELRGQVLQNWLVLGSCGVQENNTLILSKKQAGEAPFVSTC